MYMQFCTREKLRQMSQILYLMFFSTCLVALFFVALGRIISTTLLIFPLFAFNFSSNFFFRNKKFPLHSSFYYFLQSSSTHHFVFASFLLSKSLCLSLSSPLSQYLSLSHTKEISLANWRKLPIFSKFAMASFSVQHHTGRSPKVYTQWQFTTLPCSLSTTSPSSIYLPL